LPRAGELAVTAGSVARRYAAALFDVAEKSGATDRALADVRALRDLVEGHEELRKVFASPAIPASRKKAVLDAIVARAGLASVEVVRLAELLAGRDRLALVGAVASAFEARVNEARKIVPAEVVTAEPLDATSRTAIASALGRATGNEVRLTERVDPSLVGGLVARVGSLVFDGSITRQMERLRQRLLTGT
jgi:F-type H+-transporting ATPase subunit delta